MEYPGIWIHPLLSFEHLHLPFLTPSISNSLILCALEKHETAKYSGESGNYFISHFGISPQGLIHIHDNARPLRLWNATLPRSCWLLEDSDMASAGTPANSVPYPLITHFLHFWLRGTSPPLAPHNEPDTGTLLSINGHGEFRNDAREFPQLTHL